MHPSTSGRSAAPYAPNQATPPNTSTTDREADVEPLDPAGRAAVADTLDHIRTRLIVERAARGWSTYTAAAAAGVGQSFVQAFESGRPPRVDSVAALAAGYDLRLVLAGDRHLPLLNLTADEVDALVEAATRYDADTYDGNTPDLTSALAKLTRGGQA